jgi:hypothetical protein
MLKPFWETNTRINDSLIGVEFDMKLLENIYYNFQMSGHSAVLLNKGYLVLYGGYSESKCKSHLLITDLEDLSEEVDKSVVFRPFIFNKSFLSDGELPELASCSMCAHPYKNIVYIFGGSGAIWGRTNSDHFMTIDFDSNTKKIVNTTSLNGPKGTYGCTLDYYKDNLYLFGGTDGTLFFNSLYKYDLKKDKWEILNTNGTCPSTRYKHSSLIIDNYLYIIGGGQYRPIDSNLDIYKLNLDTLRWYECKFLDTIPRNILAGSSSYDSINKNIWIFGGRTDTDVRTNKLYSYNIETMNCIEYEINNKYKVKNNTGLLEKDESELEKREFHTSCLYKNKLIIIAGSTGSKRLNKVQVFYLPNFI